MIVQGQVHKGFGFTALGRIYNELGALLTQAGISSILYTVYLKQADGSRTEVEGWEDVVVSVADAVFDTLQTDAIWTEDTTGYNFRHAMDIAAGSPFDEVGRHYVVAFTLTPASGQPVPAICDLEVID